MNSFQLVLHSNDIDMSHIKRKFQAARVDSIISLDFLRNIRSLELFRCNADLVELRESLESMKVLVDLSFQTVTLTSTTCSSPVELQLANLSLKSSDIRILSIISTSSLKLLLVDPTTNFKDAELLVNLVKRQQTLEELHIGGALFIENFFKAANNNFPFKLKCLHINSKLVNSCDINEELKDFLCIQLLSLEKLILESHVHASLIKFVLEHASNLKAVKLPVSDLFTEDPLIWSDVKPFASIKHLETFECFQTINQARIFLNLFPALVELNMKNFVTSAELRDLPAFISDTFSQLQVLHINNLFCQVDLSQLNFTHLKELHVALINQKNVAVAFIERHSKTLKLISIGWINDVDCTVEITKSQLNNCKKLQNVAVSCNQNVFIKIFSSVSFDHPWTLKWRQKTYYCSPDVSSFEVFHFPDDDALFQEKFK